MAEKTADSGLRAATRWTRREFLRAAAKWSGAVGLAAAGYGGLFERSNVVLRRLDVTLDRLPEALDGLTVAQLSDFHYHAYFSAGVIRKAVELAVGLQPDLVALTGDFVTVSEFQKYDQRSAEHAVPCAELLAPLKPKLGVYAVLGNHDTFTDADLVAETLQSRGIHVLQNQALPVERNGARIWMAGVRDVLAGFAKVEEAVAAIPSPEATILLAHEPDFADHASRYPIDLQLSGHSHGGQVRLPLLGPPMLPYLGRKYPWGFRKIRRTALYTNVGLGTIVVPIRILADPEVTLITLRSGKSPVSRVYSVPQK